MSETALAQGLYKKDDLKVAELQLRGILQNTKKWNNNVQLSPNGEDFNPNNHVIAVISSGAAHGANNNKLSTTEMDSHANMVVVGSNATEIQDTGRFADVNDFANDVGQMKRVPFKDMKIAYDCPYQKKTYLLIMNNALNVPSMNHNLIPPLILDEAGLEVDTKPKIHSKNLSADSHSIFDTATELQIPLKLRGVFSYFNSRSINSEEIHDCKSYDTI